MQDNLVSVFLYGSATGINFIPKVSDINSVIVVKDINLQLLQKILKPIAIAKRHRIEAPLIFTEEYIQSSLDVFPIEFLDMKENYVVLYGKDVLKDIDVKDSYIRLFCEQQIKGKLIRIRQAYLELGLNKKGLESLMKDSLTSLMAVFRSLIRLKKSDIPIDTEKLLSKIKDLFGIEVEVLLDIWRRKINNQHISSSQINRYFDE